MARGVTTTTVGFSISKQHDGASPVRPAVATCRPRSVNENIFHIIGVIAVIVVVLKVLHLF